MKNTLLLLLSFLWSYAGYAQTTEVTGKVTESQTGTPIPFANVIFTGTQDGAITDFDGNFIARTNQPVDSIEVRYIGYIKRTKPLERGMKQIINFQLDEDVQALAEVIVYAGENPAFPILRNVVSNKDRNDKRSLSAYEYETYTKIEFDVDNISDRFKDRKVVKKITNVLDSIQVLAGEDGMPILPVFMSEAISRYYYKSNPSYKHENIIKTKVSGVGLTDGTTTSQVIGATFQQYNFYQNWLNILGKEFVSPIADGWKIYYDVFLEDSTFINDDFCYRIDFYPKREQDLAFTGSMWITKEHFALKRIDAQVLKTANLNYIEKLKIQQDLIQSEAGPWLPEKTRVVVDIIQLTETTAGMLAKFYISTKDHVVNQPKGNKFYLNPVSMEETVQDYNDDYWKINRHDSLTTSELNVFKMIDTLKRIPVVKTGMDAAKFAFTGYFKVGKMDVGPYTTFVGNNNIEGLRLGFGGRTNIGLSNKWTVGGYFGYGFDDERWKYRVYVDRILDRQPWTNVTFEYQRELEQVWLLNQQIEPTSLFYSLSRFGSLVQPFYMQKYRASLFRQVVTGFSTRLSFKHQVMDPAFDFKYYEAPGNLETGSSYRVSEVTFTSRYAKDELFVVNDNERISLGTIRWPAFNLDYTYGFKGLLGSNFSYHRFKLSIEKDQKMGLLGVSRIKLTGGYILGNLPYTMIYNPIGNETVFYVNFAYNLMDYFEFSTDKYVELRYRHHFEGFILNTIPLMKKLKWRLIGSANMLTGEISDKNINMVQYKTDQSGNAILPFNRLDWRPYVELGYGVENIFRVFSVEAFHRLTYLDRPDVSKFALKFSIQLIL